MSDLSEQRRYYERMIDEIADAHREQLDRLKAENARLKQKLEAVGTAAYLYGRTDLADENAKLREQTELLVTLLRNDCDIEASWDGLRHFWSIELTDDGCLMRDRACKAEAENAKLRELMYERAHKHAIHHMTEDELRITAANVMAENDKLRELVESYGMIANEAVCDYYDRDEMLADANATASELGIEVGV